MLSITPAQYALTKNTFHKKIIHKIVRQIAEKRKRAKNYNAGKAAETVYADAKNIMKYIGGKGEVSDIEIMNACEFGLNRFYNARKILYETQSIILMKHGRHNYYKFSGL